MSRPVTTYNRKDAHGVIIGKFMPLHLGHELMIEMAADELKHLTVIVSGTHHEKPALELRYEIIKKKYENRENVRIIPHVDEYGDAKSYDENGTAQDADFWDYWISTILENCDRKIDYVVSSDLYGRDLAHTLGAKWMPVDPKREMFNISARQIRAEPLKYWKYLSREFRPFYAKRVVVVGAESSGKSTLVNDLARDFGSIAVPEYGRILTEAGHFEDERNLTIETFRDIVRRQEAMTRKAAESSENGVVFVDTEKIITWLYAQEYLSHPTMEFASKFDPEEFDLWVLVRPNIPWVDDGTGRIMPNQEDREDFCERIYKKLRANGLSGRFCMISEKQFLDLEETDREKRVRLVSEKMADLFMTQDEKQGLRKIIDDV